jgi:hypothetical protein
MFDASVLDDFFKDDDEKSYSVLELCNILHALKEDKEEVEGGLCISQGPTQKNTHERLDEVLQAIKIECEEDQFVPNAYAILSRVLTDVHRMRIQSDAGDLHPNVVFEKMDDDTPNSVKILKDFHEKYLVFSKKQKIG